MRYLRMRFRFRARNQITFPPNPVNTFRGALGYQLLRIACIQRKSTEVGCKSCSVCRNCAYAQCFETGSVHVGAEYTANGDDLPHMMVIDSGIAGSQTLTTGSLFDFTVQLSGCAVESAPYMIVAARNAGLIGLTSARILCDLEEVIDDCNARTVWAADADQVRLPMVNDLVLPEPDLVKNDECEMKLRFISPVAFKDRHSGSITMEPQFSRIIGSMLRRYSAFSASDGRPLAWNFAAITEVSRQVRLAGMNVEPVYWERFSTRQQQRIAVSGIIGVASYVGPVAMFQELLGAGEIIRCGRSTTFGQGRINVVSTRKLVNRDPCNAFCE